MLVDMCKLCWGRQRACQRYPDNCQEQRGRDVPLLLRHRQGHVHCLPGKHSNCHQQLQRWLKRLRLEKGCDSLCNLLA